MAFECEASFLINFTGTLLCTFVLGSVDPQGDGNPADDPITPDASAINAVYGRNPFSKNYIFTKGSANSGSFDDRISYSVDGGNLTTTAPGGVTVRGSFSTTPNFGPGIGPRDPQPGIYSGYVDIVNPVNTDNSPNPNGYQGTALTVNIDLGLDR